MIYNVISLVVAYLLGSIPFGYLLVRYVFTQGEDVRDYGSGATGATNVTRVVGLKGGGLTYLLDVLKGLLAVVMAGWVSRWDVQWMGAAGIMSMIGHSFPVWIGFRGGKSVATGVGAYILLSPLSVLSALLVWGVVVYWKRYVALGSILAAAAVPLLVLFWDGIVDPKPAGELQSLLAITILGTLLIAARHHENIRRLLNGTEDKIGQKAQEPTGSEA